MNSIYFDGNKYYSFGKHKHGGYLKYEVDNTGKFKRGGLISMYDNQMDMNNDMTNLFEVVPEYKSGGSIHINPDNVGKFNATKARTGKTTEELTHSSNPLTRKRAIFAQNAAKWKHQRGGEIVPKDQASQIYAGDLIFSGGPAYTNNNLTNLATIQHPNQINPMIANDDYGSNIQDNTVIKPTYNRYNNQSTQANITQNQPYQFNPRKLNVYGNQISERALDRTTAFNLASVMGEQAYKNPLIVPKFEYKRQFVQPDFNPIYDQERVARRNISENQRSTAGLMGNLQQLNANMVKAKMAAARANQTEQRGLDAQYQGQKQQYANQLAVARQNVENANKADQAEKRQYLSDTFTNWEKADQQKAQLYNAELATLNQMNTYVNQLSPEYKAVMGKDGVIQVVFKSTGKPVPQEEFDKKQKGAGYKAYGNTNKVSGPPKIKKKGGMINPINLNPVTNSQKKLRTRLY